MAQITITVPDQFIDRLKNAFSKTRALNVQNPAVTEVVPGSLLDIQASIRQFIRSKMIEHEVSETATLKRAELSKEVWDDNI
jgi:hypothetical protein